MRCAVLLACGVQCKRAGALTEAMEPIDTDMESQLRNVRSLARKTLGSTRTPYKSVVPASMSFSRHDIARVVAVERRSTEWKGYSKETPL